ncbi:inorganic phosphate transporter [Halopelagius longus]|uniref:Phosphate transporter n=1 Tax=Halopelagius longus TaxID=1236180 RepID=A0A1H1E6B6_9EURY|nr:inorganic phosphate transporter [Halopelagius longus]RDI71625.1 inorganic phosphate transporter [Halopelagius longus]SDQ84234.1 inorganic phosphate transporter, PiT family [Halopelagius longus]
MVATGVLLTLVVASLASLFMAWAIGAGSSGSTPFAPAVGANAISIMRAGFVVGLLGFAGAVLQGANVTQAVGNELVVGSVLTATASIVALATAAALVAVGVFTGYPIATAFTVTGAVVGVGLANGGAPAWEKYQVIVSLWVLTPFVGGGTAYATARLLRSESVSERVAVPVLAGIVGFLVANIRFALLGPADAGGMSLAGYAASFLPTVTVAGIDLGTVGIALLFALLTAAVVSLDMREPAAGQRHFLLFLGGLVAFSAGGSQVGLAIGPLVPLLDAVTIPLVVVLAGGGLGLLAGSWTGAPRMIKALAQDYSSLGPRRSIAAMIPSFAIAQAAVALGVPVSFNEIIVSAIIGSGYAAGGSGVSRDKMLKTVLAWVGSLALAFALSYGVFLAVSSVL